MKVAIITQGINPQPAVKGGAVETLVDMLINYNEEYYNCQLDIYSVSEREAELKSLQLNNTRMIYLKRNFFIEKLFKNRLIPIRMLVKCFSNQVKKEICKNTYDVVIIENEYYMGESIKKVINSNIPFLLHLHNNYIKSCKDINKLRCYDKIITISKFLEDNLKTLNPQLVVKTVWNGVDFNKFKTNDLSLQSIERYKKKLGINLDDIVIVFAGRLIPEKGIEELLIAFSSMSSKKKLKLVIVGSSSFANSSETAFIKKIKEFGKKSENIIFTGYIPYEKMPLVYSIADIGCVPSVIEEAFGMTVIEQMAMKLPVIVSDSGGIPYIVNEKCAITVNRDKFFVQNLKTALETLANNDILRESMAEEAIKQSRKFSSNRFAYNMFKEVLEKVK